MPFYGLKKTVKKKYIKEVSNTLTYLPTYLLTCLPLVDIEGRGGGGEGIVGQSYTICTPPHSLLTNSLNYLSRQIHYLRFTPLLVQITYVKEASQ